MRTSARIIELVCLADRIFCIEILKRLLNATSERIPPPFESDSHKWQIIFRVVRINFERMGVFFLISKFYQK